jgi:hypothetical protein
MKERDGRKRQTESVDGGSRRNGWKGEEDGWWDGMKEYYDEEGKE